MVHGGGDGGGGYGGDGGFFYGGGSGEDTSACGKCCSGILNVINLLILLLLVIFGVIWTFVTLPFVIYATCIVVSVLASCLYSPLYEPRTRSMTKGGLRFVTLLNMTSAVVACVATWTFTLKSEQVEVLPGQTKLVTASYDALFLDSVSIQCRDTVCQEFLESYYYVGIPSLTGPVHCNHFNSTLQHLNYGMYEYDGVELNDGGKGVGKLFVVDSPDCSGSSTEKPCKLELDLYRGLEATTTDEGKLCNPVSGPVKAKLGRPAAISFMSKYTNQAHALTYYNNDQSNPSSGVSARATISYCEKTFDVSAGGGREDACVGSPCEFTLGASISASLVLVVPSATSPVTVTVIWNPRFELMTAVALLLPLVLTVCVYFARMSLGARAQAQRLVSPQAEQGEIRKLTAPGAYPRYTNVADDDDDDDDSGDCYYFWTCTHRFYNPFCCCLFLAVWLLFLYVLRAVSRHASWTSG